VELTVLREPTHTIAAVTGRIDTTTAADFEKQCMELLASDTPGLLLDCARIDYISSAGLRSVLVLAKQAAASSKAFGLCGLSGMVADVFALAGFDQVLPVYTAAADFHPEE